MKSIILILIGVFISGAVFSQDIYYTKNGRISFFSKAPLEDIKAQNNEVVSFVNIRKNEIAFSLLIKGFKFDMALMEEHFNANYLESDKYPKASFKGKVTDANNLNLDVDGVYNVTVQGVMNIHNVSQNVKTKATIIIKNKQLSGQAKFSIRVADYGIKIPSVVSQNIAEVVEVTVDCDYLPLEK